jgi:HTH-type transcriptional regulator/antitoxin HigA
MKNEFLIDSNKNYHDTMLIIYQIMNKGEFNLKSHELEELESMTRAAEKYEDDVLHLKPKPGPRD